MKPEDFMALVEKYAATITLGLLFDMARAASLRLTLEPIDNEKQQGTKSALYHFANPMEGEVEPEITDEMLEAGIAVARLYSSEDSLADMLTATYRAMRQRERDFQPQPPALSH